MLHRYAGFRPRQIPKSCSCSGPIQFCKIAPFLCSFHSLQSSPSHPPTVYDFHPPRATRWYVHALMPGLVSPALIIQIVINALLRS